MIPACHNYNKQTNKRGNTLLTPIGDPLLDLELAREAELAAAR